MKIVIISLIAFTLSLALYSFVKPNTDTYSLTIEVKNLRNARGIIQFTLYNKDGSIPDEDYTNYYKILKGEIVSNASTITFKNIPLGRYAVNLLHDENKNGKIDKGFILPTEGIGFSNFQTIGLLNRPNFSKANFEIKEDMTVTVKMIYL